MKKNLVKNYGRDIGFYYIYVSISFRYINCSFGLGVCWWNFLNEINVKMMENLLEGVFIISWSRD